MIPLRDSIRSRSFPIVNVAIIVACVIVFLLQIASAEHGQTWAFRPSMLIPGRGPGAGEAVVALFLSMFMHGGILHIAGNMLFLWVFGDNVEDRMGHGRYLVFYLVTGTIATLAHSVFTIFTPVRMDVPLVGASGAIAGVLGAYLVLFPISRVRTLVFLFFFVTVIDLPAPFFLVYWFIIQLFQGVGAIGLDTGVAYMAHIGGFGAGYLLARRLADTMAPPPPPRIDYPMPPRPPRPPRITRLRIE